MAGGIALIAILPARGAKSGLVAKVRGKAKISVSNTALDMALLLSFAARNRLRIR